MSHNPPSRQNRSKGRQIPDLGRPHRRQRDRLLAAHIDGTPCPCIADDDCGPACPCRRAGHGMPMYRDPYLNVDGAPLEADHTLARSQGGMRADRLLLRTCNRSRGDGTRSGRSANGGGSSSDGPWPLNPMTGTHCPPWWTRDWSRGGGAP